jgi:hypothetical protein
MYYLRTKPAAAAIQFTVDKTKLKSGVENKKAAAMIEPEESSDGQVTISGISFVSKTFWTFYLKTKFNPEITDLTMWTLAATHSLSLFTTILNASRTYLLLLVSELGQF